MPQEIVYAAQAFQKKGKRLEPGQMLMFKSAAEAARRAERGAQNFNGRTVGFVAIQTVVDKETGEVDGEPVVLARFGELPKELRQEE